MSCQYCKVLLNLEGRRFYRDSESLSFVIIENMRTLSPMLVAKHHGQAPQNLAEFVLMFSEMHAVCKALYGIRYYLRVDDLQSHFAIHAVKVLTTQNSDSQNHNRNELSSCVLIQECCM